MPQVQAKPSFLATEKHNGVGLLPERPGTTRSSRIPREYHDFVLGQHSCGSHGAWDQRVELQWASHTSLFPSAGHGPGLCKGVPGTDISQLPLRAGRRAPAVPFAGQQLHLQLQLGPRAMTAGDSRPRETVKPGTCRQGQGAACALRTHNSPWKLKPTSSSLTTA